jgi:hypothetical protein
LAADEPYDKNRLKELTGSEGPFVSSMYPGYAPGYCIVLVDGSRVAVAVGCGAVVRYLGSPFMLGGEASGRLRGEVLPGRFRGCAAFRVCVDSDACHPLYHVSATDDVLRKVDPEPIVSRRERCVSIPFVPFIATPPHTD